MRDTGATPAKARRPWRACAIVCLFLFAPPANAQDDGTGALRFLKPWIERQLFGRETSEPGATPASPAEGPPAPAGATPDQAPPAPPPEDTAPDQATPPGEAPTEPTTGGEISAPDDGGMDLGGSPPNDEVETGAPATVAPPTGSAAVPPDLVAETPGVPVEAKPEALRFGVLAGRSVSTTLATIGPVAEELQTILGRPVEILPLSSYDAMIDAQVQRRIDGGFFSAAAFAAADTSCACLEPVVAPRASDGTLAYHAVIVVRAGSGFASAADLAGKTVAIGAADSIGARRLQLAGLVSEGVDPTTFGAVIEAESAEAAVRLVARGSADAAFAWSSLAGGVNGGYSRGTLTQLVAGGELAMDRLAVIWSSPPIAHGPFALMRTLPEADKGKIEEYLVALSAGNPAAYDMLDPLYGGGYAAVDPQDYSGLATLLAESIDTLRLPGGPATTGATSTPGGVPPVSAPMAPN